ncbi:MAG: hypothetical protein MSS55_01770 [Ruminococcus sp.]|nr:hypothetical protein [Ruminococcus sp.]
MKKGFRKVCAALCSTALLCAATAVPASASTVSDVIAAAYAVGIPAQYVQEGIAMYGGGNYTSEQCDQAIASIYSYQGRVDELLEDYFGVPSNGGGNSNASDNNSGSNSNAGGNAGSSGNNANSSSSSNSSNNSNSSSENTGGPSGDSDGSKSFTDMTLDEKIDYVNQLPAEERSDYISNLTTEERNSFIKQLPVSDKAAVLNEFLGVGDSLGLHFTVDEMTNDSVVVSARDKDGKLIDVSAMGVTVEETGKSYTTPITIAALLAGGGICGVSAILFAAGKKKRNEE